jgi:hypothetical protein
MGKSHDAKKNGLEGKKCSQNLLSSYAFMAEVVWMVIPIR